VKIVADAVCLASADASTSPADDGYLAWVEAPARGQPAFTPAVCPSCWQPSASPPTRDLAGRHQARPERRCRSNRTGPRD
jgi:hypothetical protein